MIAPAALLLLVFLIAPFFMAFGLSLTDQPLVPRLEQVTDPETNETTMQQKPPDFIALENYGDLLRVKIFQMEPHLETFMQLRIRPAQEEPSVM